MSGLQGPYWTKLMETMTEPPSRRRAALTLIAAATILFLFLGWRSRDADQSPRGGHVAGPSRHASLPPEAPAADEDADGEDHLTVPVGSGMLARDPEADPALVDDLARWLLGDAPPEQAKAFAEEFVKDPDLRAAYQEARKQGKSKGDFVREVKKLKAFARLASLLNAQPSFSGGLPLAGTRRGEAGRPPGGAAGAAANAAHVRKFARMGFKRLEFPAGQPPRFVARRPGVHDALFAQFGLGPLPSGAAAESGAGPRESASPQGSQGSEAGAIAPLGPIGGASAAGRTCASFFNQAQVDALAEACIVRDVCDFWLACEAAGVKDRCDAAAAAGLTCTLAKISKPPPAGGGGGGGGTPPAGGQTTATTQPPGGGTSATTQPAGGPSPTQAVWYTGVDGQPHMGAVVDGVLYGNDNVQPNAFAAPISGSGAGPAPPGATFGGGPNGSFDSPSP